MVLSVLDKLVGSIPILGPSCVLGVPSLSIIINIIFLTAASLLIYKKGGLNYITNYLSTNINQNKYSDYYSGLISNTKLTTLSDKMLEVHGKGKYNNLIDMKPTFKNGIMELNLLLNTKSEV